MAKIMKIAGWVITGIIVLFIAGLGFIHFMPGYSFSLVRSGSMVPAIKMGDVIITRPAGEANIQPGRIVMYQHDNEIITHRVLSIDGNTLITKGDANEEPDPWKTTSSNVKGVYLFKLPYIGFAMNFVRTKTGWFLAIIIPTMVILGLIVKDILKEAFKDEKTAANSGEVKPIAKGNETENEAG